MLISGQLSIFTAIYLVGSSDFQLLGCQQQPLAATQPRHASQDVEVIASCDGVSDCCFLDEVDVIHNRLLRRTVVPHGFWVTFWPKSY